MSPRNNEQNAAIKDERREEILTAALKVFATKGFAATKISDIVERAGMSHGLVYHYFKSKEELFSELLRQAIEVSAQSLLAVEALPMRPIEKVSQLARYILGGIENNGVSAYYFMIVVHASVMESPQGSKELLDGSTVAVQTLTRILAAGQQAGEVREGDPLGMAMAFFAAIQGLAIYKLSIEGFTVPDPELLVNIVRK